MRCHYVPEFYLKHFLADDNKVFYVYNREDNSITPQTPKSTLAIVDYYLFDNMQGEKDDFVEKMFSWIEGEAKKIFDEIVANPHGWDSKIKPVVDTFLAFQACRIPSNVKIIQEVYMAGVDHIWDKMNETSKDPDKSKQEYESFRKSNKPGSDMSYESFCTTLAMPKERFRINIDEKQSLMNSLFMSETIYKQLQKMTLCVHEIKNSNFFVTSDNPVNIFVPFPNNQAIFGGGIGLSNVEVSFPLTPTICLRLGYKNHGRYKVADFRFIEEVNKRLIANANKYIISPYKSNRILKLLKELKSFYNKPVIDTEVMKNRFKGKDVI